MAHQFGMVEFYNKLDNEVDAVDDKDDEEYWTVFNDITELMAYYRGINDTVILDKFAAKLPHLKNLAQANGELVICDLGAGNGRLAEKIISNASMPVHYIFIEPNKTAIAQAKARLQKYIDSSSCRISWHNVKFDDLDFDVMAHCMISSGGPLNQQIVPSKDAALTNLKKIKTMLATNGILIATGVSRLFINSKHFEQNDFKVHDYAAEVKVPVDFSKVIDLPEEAIDEHGGLEKYNHYLREEVDSHIAFHPFIQCYVCENNSELQMKKTVSLK